MKRLIKAFLIAISSLALAFFSSLSCYAHPSAEEHNRELEAVLFESGYSKYQPGDIKKYITALEYASNLTIDQFGGSGEDKYDALRKWRMGGLPLSFDKIDYSEDLFGNGKKINANTHRHYTHQGWDIDYGNSKVNKFWNARKHVLQGTVNTIFDFGKFTPVFGYDDKCNSLAGIIYYVHILGDYAEADDLNKIQYLADLAGRTDGCDMIPALQKYVEILFTNQRSSKDYKDLMKGMDEVADKAAPIYKSIGGVNTDEEFLEYHQCAMDLLALLQNHIPGLLKNEEFFKNVFYPNA